MDDLTSGFNIGTNYTTHPRFNAMVGFTEQEVREMIDYYRQFYTFNHTTDELIEVMKPWYDNYCFAPECVDESEDITNPSNFVSLLYYFGMLSIAGKRRDETMFKIPNQVVREQMYGYLTRAYQENDLSLDEYRRKKLMSSMAWDGNWRGMELAVAEEI